LGTHSGVHRFTIGQRKGLGVAIGQPAYVTKIDAEKAVVHLGLAHDLDTHGALLEDFVAFDAAHVADANVLAKIRYRHAGVPARCDVLKNGRAIVWFEVPTRAVTPGQVCVLYRDDEVLGGGRIASSLQQWGTR
jgi:tRNA-specific 2-thiouridylase